MINTVDIANEHKCPRNRVFFFQNSGLVAYFSTPLPGDLKVGKLVHRYPFIHQITYHIEKNSTMANIFFQKAVDSVSRDLQYLKMIYCNYCTTLTINASVSRIVTWQAELVYESAENGNFKSTATAAWTKKIQHIAPHLPFRMRHVLTGKYRRISNWATTRNIHFRYSSYFQRSCGNFFRRQVAYYWPSNIALIVHQHHPKCSRRRDVSWGFRCR